jgi:hypothetical protein
MRRTKHKSVVAVDHIRHRHITYGGMSNVDISVMEKDDGTLLVEVESFDGKVLLLLPKGIQTEEK